MENDSIRASGTNTLVDIWIEGKIRAISVSHDAIGAFLGFERATGMSDKDRCEFVRTHLPVVVAAAKARLGELKPGVESVMLESGHLPRPDGRSGDRRRAARRKADRRKAGNAVAKQPERRRGDRRKSERRARPVEAEK
jgi:hypothetical protein